jgi:hypothetical protein
MKGIEIFAMCCVVMGASTASTAHKGSWDERAAKIMSNAPNLPPLPHHGPPIKDTRTGSETDSDYVFDYGLDENSADPKDKNARAAKKKKAGEGDYYDGDGHSSLEWDEQKEQLVIDDKLLAELRVKQAELKHAAKLEADKVRAARQGKATNKLKRTAAKVAEKMKKDQEKLRKVNAKVKKAEVKLDTDKEKLDSWVQGEFGSMKNLHREFSDAKQNKKSAESVASRLNADRKELEALRHKVKQAKATAAKDVGASVKNPEEMSEKWIDKEVAKRLAEASKDSVKSTKNTNNAAGRLRSDANSLAGRLKKDQAHLAALSAKLKGAKTKEERDKNNLDGWLQSEFGKMQQLQKGKSPKGRMKTHAPEQNELGTIKKREKIENKKLRKEKKEEKLVSGRAKQLLKVEERTDRKKLRELVKVEHKLEREEKSNKHPATLQTLNAAEMQERKRLKRNERKEKSLQGPRDIKMKKRIAKEQSQLAELKRKEDTLKHKKQGASEPSAAEAHIEAKERAEKAKLNEERNEEKQIENKLKQMKTKLNAEKQDEENARQSNWMQKEFGEMGGVKRQVKRADAKTQSKEATLKEEEREELKKLHEDKRKEKKVHGKGAKKMLKKREATDRTKLRELHREEQLLEHPKAKMTKKKEGGSVQRAQHREHSSKQRRPAPKHVKKTGRGYAKEKFAQLRREMKEQRIVSATVGVVCMVLLGIIGA